VGVGQQPTDDRALPVIDVTHDYDVHSLWAVHGGRDRFRRGNRGRHDESYFSR
jgi:hypothetical protein